MPVVRSLDKGSRLFGGGTSCTDLNQECNYVQTMVHRSWNRGEADNARLLSDLPKLDPREQHFRIAIDDNLNIFLRHLGPAFTTKTSKAVLYVHGATFPSALSIAHRFDGYSWRDSLNAAGFDVWGLDFLGYGGSDRYPEMAQSPEGMPALGRAESASRQIERAAEFIAEYHGGTRISIIAHSWGSVATGLFAGRRPELIDRAVFFAPIAQRPKQSEAQRFPAWRLVSLQEQWRRFTEDVPPEESAVLSQHHFDEWGSLYLDTDARSRTRSPASVQVPTGPVQEIAEAFAGQLAYNPASITSPIAIIRGAWDSLVTDPDARWLFDALKKAPNKRDVKISRGTHLMHLEESRYALYREAQTFLEAGDQPADASAEREAIRQFSSPRSGDRHMKEATLAHDSAATQIPGYDYARPRSAHSPLSMEELRQLEATVGWSEDDARILQRSGSIFKEKAEQMVDSWRSVIGAQPHLAKWFFGPDGKPDDEYKAKVKKRFVQWVLDTCFRPHDQAWLDYQEEIGLRHTPAKKNQTDGAQTPSAVPLRYLLGFVTVVTTNTRQFFKEAGLSGQELQKLEDAWTKAVQLHVTLWSRPYVKDGLW
jgi:pimeloyl-ACP methyl ester carboxylesterase